MRLSEYKAGTILVDGDGKVFIHDGFVNADGYGVVIGENSDGIIHKSNRIGNWMKEGCYREATSSALNSTKSITTRLASAFNSKWRSRAYSNNIIIK